MQLALVSPPREDREPNPNCRSHQAAIYKGAEYLVLADISLNGFSCFPVAEGLSYDLVVDLRPGLRRVQVKSTGGIRSERRLGGHGPRSGYFFEGDGLSKYRDGADVIAFVALDLRRVFYMGTALLGRRVILKPEKFSPDSCRLSLETVLKAS